MSESTVETINYSTENFQTEPSIEHLNSEHDNYVLNNPSMDLKEPYQQSPSNNMTDQLADQTITTSLNQDPDVEYIQRPNSNRITYRQDIAIRYLQPPTPPPSGPLIIREIRASPPPERHPLTIYQRSNIPRTPPPIIIRERPPVPPPIVPSHTIHKYIPAPPPPPQRVIIERQAPLPQKPPPIIIEKWLPYKTPPQREVIVERAEPLPQRSVQKNTIITHEAPDIELVRNIRHLDTVRVDPRAYTVQYGPNLVSNEYVLNIMEQLSLKNNYAQSLMTNNNQFQTINSYVRSQASMADQEHEESNLCQIQDRDIEEIQRTNADEFNAK
ncbi:unnamed protein product [Rotaria socialis]|uniref:Uncharacterized protein n=2 Tax=Rotaria socialis TaxID=392032 RepID=A0A818MQX7_9BILA|nr:unnamed protein product [Rotaria socialis]CAF3443114.1 unnamed protein product [Rotaria socialis]CAF3482630.1 unnamed protein product [Rotaria socialis]CAF3593589.1 unnamed protein product [Rotaria socialis]CAF4251524.1 unnamed protein product [Rotaria socialis]